MKVASCSPKKHDWFVNERSVDISEDGLAHVSIFSYTERMCVKCFETILGGAELQRLFDLANEGKMVLFQFLFLNAILLYSRTMGSMELPLDKKLKKWLMECIEGYEFHHKIGVQVPSTFQEDGKNFVKAISRTLQFLVECKYITIRHHLSGRTVSLTREGIDKIEENEKLLPAGARFVEETRDMKSLGEK